MTPAGTVLQAIDAIKTELNQRVGFFTDSQKLVEAQRIEQRTHFDLELLDQIGFAGHRKLFAPSVRDARPANRRPR